MLLKNKDEINILERLEQCIKDNYGNPLICSGCAHSSADDQFPGKPSGERPCFFCLRNINREEWQKQYIDNPINKTKTKLETWYDGSKPIKIPMDCYHSCDFTEQVSVWSKKDKKGKTNVGIITT